MGKEYYRITKPSLDKSGNHCHAKFSPTITVAETGKSACLHNRRQRHMLNKNRSAIIDNQVAAVNTLNSQSVLNSGVNHSQVFGIALPKWEDFLINLRVHGIFPRTAVPFA